jgi:hypothetical protein
VPLQLCLITENITTKPALTVVVAGAIVSLSVSSDKAQTLMLTLKGCMTKPTGSFATNVVIWGKSSEAATRGNIGDMTKYVPNGTRCKELLKQWL